MRTVLYFQSSFSSVCRRVTDGVRDLAAKVGWRLHVVPYANAAEREDIRFFNHLGAEILPEQNAGGYDIIVSKEPVYFVGGELVVPETADETIPLR